MTAARRVFPMLSVASLERALAFYAGLLGGRERYRFPPEGPAAFVTLGFGETELGLGALGDAPPLHGRPLRPASGHRIELCVYVDDLDAIVARARAANVPVPLPPTAQPWGERIAYLEDPDGNLVMLAQ
ncbi:MAG TPA: VOC family protein [Anaeromyxobacter sp.]|nr:VOC family protein [Anaeromyxobacter sp.]